MGNRGLRRSSLRRKLMLYFLFLVFLPTITLGVFGPMIYAQSIEREARDHTVRMISQVNLSIEFHVLEIERLIDMVAETQAVRTFFDSGRAGPASRPAITDTLAAVCRTHPGIAGVILVTEADEFISEGFYRIARDPLTSEDWYSLSREAPGEVRLISRPFGRNIRSTQEYGADEVVSVVKSVVDVADGRIRGAILFDMKLSAVEELFRGTALGKGGFLFIADAEGGMVYAPVNRIVYRVPLAPLAGDSPGATMRIAGADYQVLSRRSPYTGWRTVGVFPLAETLLEVDIIRTWSLLIGGATMALATLAAFFFTASISSPVIALRGLMKKAEEGDLSVRFPDGPHDEIGELGRGFNEMIGRVQDLIGQVYREQQSKREAELRILQEQIKPHFLYNTLDTIQWMAQEHRVEDVVSMVGSLTRLFRIGLSRGKELIPLTDELTHVESYLRIQKMRYEDKFDYSIDRGEGIGGMRVLRLILQPLVENAIYHGIKERKGHGNLAVRAELRGEELLLTVRDDGIGMEADFLARLNQSLEEGTGPAVGGYGIRNVNERIRLTFGKPFGLSYESAPGGGVSALVRHPLLESED